VRAARPGPGRAAGGRGRRGGPGAAAVANGLTQDELVEALTHLAFYAGWPSAMAALTQLKTIVADTGS
jgi:Carboxymuconolactone decarboxylase family